MSRVLSYASIGLAFRIYLGLPPQKGCNKMNIQTKYLGNIDVKEAKVIQFPAGLPGFIDETKFVLLDLPGNEAFQILQSVTSEHIAYIVTNPYHFYHEFEYELEENVLESLSIKSEKDVIVLNIETLKDPFHTSTMNLKAPIILNSAEMHGKQYILNISDYSAKAPLSRSPVGKEPLHASTHEKTK